MVSLVTWDRFGNITSNRYQRVERQRRVELLQYLARMNEENILRETRDNWLLRFNHPCALYIMYVYFNPSFDR